MTTTHDERWSTFALDAHWMAGRPGDPALEAHLATCAACRAYLASLDAAAASDAPRAGAPVRPRRAVKFLFQSAAAAAGVLALAAAVTLFVRTRSAVDAHDDYVGIKGTPAVQLLVRRDGRTTIWDGASKVHPGDALALRVVCEGLAHAAVVARDPHAAPARWSRLSDAPCPATPAVLPFTLNVDGQPGDERLAVILSKTPLDDRALEAAAEGDTRSSTVWTTRFLLPKSEDRK
jgi:hypothetical protein